MHDARTSRRSRLFDELASQVADTGDRELVTALVRRLEDLAGIGLGDVADDSMIVLARRFARAHRWLLADDHRDDVAELQRWLTLFRSDSSAEQPTRASEAARRKARPALASMPAAERCTG